MLYLYQKARHVSLSISVIPSDSFQSSVFLETIDSFPEFDAHLLVVISNSTSFSIPTNRFNESVSVGVKSSSKMAEGLPSQRPCNGERHQPDFF